MRSVVVLCVLVPLALGCPSEPRVDLGSRVVTPSIPPSPQPPPPTPPRAPVPHTPIELYEGGTHRTVDLADERDVLTVDLGDDWTPVLFEESDGPGAPVLPHPYRPTYLALAHGEFPDDHHGAKAREDEYLELYGIAPSLAVLRARMERASSLACASSLDLRPIEQFSGYVGYEDSARAQTEARRLAQGERLVMRLRTEQSVAAPAAPDVAALARADQDSARAFLRVETRFLALDAIQKRLQCEGYFAGRGRFVRGALDWATHEAIAAFERRHRMLGWGNVGRETLAALRRSPLALERESVVRVLTERAMHDAGIVEDGSMATLDDGRPNTYPGPDGRDVPVPNMEAAVREAVVAAFGLGSEEGALTFLRGLGEGPSNQRVAYRGVTLPPYHAADMELSVEIDRGDVWYEFPYDEQGRERPQGVERRPRLTLFVTYAGRRIPLVRFGTTIGGWRSEYVGETLMWAYKGSPPGPVIWEKIVSAPVWLPPETTPPRSLLTRTRDGLAPNRHEVGPSYASAYGLVAAYHRPAVRRADGSVEGRGDQGIRTHGSVDYMSIARRFSHGCHRLHNHLAVRLMSFVLRHRAHRRVGEDHVAYTRHIEVDGKRYTLEVSQGGYEFALARPIHVEVLPGRILGARESPIDVELPKFDPAVGAYVLPDGGAATVDRLGNVTPIAWPLDGGPDGGLDGGVPADMGIHDAGQRDSGVQDASVRDAARDVGTRSVTDGGASATPRRDVSTDVMEGQTP